MAYTAAVLMQLRRLINDEEEPYTYEDVELTAMLDAEEGSVMSAAATFWYAKASDYQTSVDISEAGSSRKMSDLFKNALALAKQFDESGGAGSTDAPVAAATTRRIVRR
jgi:hypothetical protein